MIVTGDAWPGSRTIATAETVNDFGNNKLANPPKKKTAAVMATVPARAPMNARIRSWDPPHDWPPGVQRTQSGPGHKTKTLQ